MSLFEFVVLGPPVSQQTRRQERRREWIRTVRQAAELYWPAGRPPFTGDLAVKIFYFYDQVPIDVDNIVKPIHDAMKQLVFDDDVQITESEIRRRNLAGPYTILGMTPILAEGLDRGREFIYVTVSRAPAGGELP